MEVLKNCQQRVGLNLNGQFSPSTEVNAGVPHESVLGPLIYTKALPNGLQSNQKLFTGDTSLFSTVHDTTKSTVRLNHDLSN